jgi:HSP20 family protein
MVATRRDLTFGLGRSLDQIIQDVFGAFAQAVDPAPASGVHPALDVWQDDEAFHLEAELPGVKLADLELRLHGRDFSLSGERKRPEGEAAAHNERFFGRFERSVRLPADVEPERVQATLENGVLHVVLPKSARARVRKIEVQQR